MQRIFPSSRAPRFVDFDHSHSPLNRCSRILQCPAYLHPDRIGLGF